jgi:hypothetical protein
VAIAIAPSDPAFAGGQQMIEACLGSLERPSGEATPPPAPAATDLPAQEEGSTLGPLDSQETLVLVDDDSTGARAGR